jgi:alkylation response protein AidB-like acyl-CoA dehydrogenase
VLEFKTRIVRNGGAVRLNGVKFYCTGALFAQWIPVFALDETDKLVIVYVPQGVPGLTIIDDWSGSGQRTTASGAARFEDVEVAAENVVPIWRAYERPSTMGAFAQILHVAIDVGIAVAALRDAADFVRVRSRPWAESGLPRAADEPHIIKRFGELHIALDAADALLQRAARTFDDLDGRTISEQAATLVSVAVASAKSFATDVVIEITNALFELSGTASMDEKYNLDRHWRNARIHTLHDPARWKQFHVGNWFLNGVAPPRVYS